MPIPAHGVGVGLEAPACEGKLEGGVCHEMPHKMCAHGWRVSRHGPISLLAPYCAAGADLSGPQKMFAGLLAGAAAATVTYPLEALR